MVLNEKSADRVQSVLIQSITKRLGGSKRSASEAAGSAETENAELRRRSIEQDVQNGLLARPQAS
jgi:hypothetical protein